MAYHQLTLQERYYIEIEIKNGTSQNKIAKALNCSQGTISKSEFATIGKDLKQRVSALNLFLEDLYYNVKIIKEGIIPEAFLHQAKGYLKEFCGFSLSKKIRTHINGIDLVKDTKNDE